jgi:hypothetical protein
VGTPHPLFCYNHGETETAFRKAAAAAAILRALAAKMAAVWAVAEQEED